MKYTIGVDAGGTKIVAALISKGKVIKKIEMPTKANKGKKEIIKRIAESINLIKEGINKKNIRGIGIGIAGWTNNKGTVINAPNMRNFKNVRLKQILKKKFKLPVAVGNDTNVFALAESLLGAGKGKNNVICFTLGTGVGGGIVLNKRLYVGKGFAGELGHMTIAENGLKCVCGNKGCLEEYTSARAVARYSKKHLGKVLPPLDIENMGISGDKRAIKVYEELGNYFGLGLVNVNNIFDPDLIVVGGSLANSDYLILDPARKVLEKGAIYKPVKVVRAKLGPDSTVIGATLLLQ